MLSVLSAGPEPTTPWSDPLSSSSTAILFLGCLPDPVSCMRFSLWMRTGGPIDSREKVDATLLRQEEHGRSNGRYASPGH